MRSPLQAVINGLLPGYQETTAFVGLDQLGLEHPERAPYTASPWWALRLLLKRSDVSRADAFLEYGCGKGRVVLDAARRYNFGSVVGVELADELSEVGRRLVARERMSLQCANVSIVTGDASEFPVPDDTTIVYLYNPFNGETLRSVRANLIASLERAPRRMRVIYLNPDAHETLVEDGSFVLRRRVRVPRVVNGAAIYDAVLS